MLKKMLLLIMLGFSLALGSFWALKAQDPAPQKPATETTERSSMRPQSQTTQTDLSGTYTGTFNCEGLGLTGETTLTINGNEFTTADGKTGRIVASTTGGYTAVAFQLNAADPKAPPQIVSLRARKSGTRLTLMSAPGTAAGQRCSFVPGRAVARGRRQRTPPATGTEVTSPTAEPSATPAASPMESPMPSQTPSPVPPTPSPEPMPSPSPTPSSTPMPMPSPTPSGSPTPMPSPSPGAPTPSPTPGEPTPSPSASPTPSPTPTPSPSPSPSARPQ